MGDDVSAPHLYTVTAKSSNTLNELFLHLERKSYLTNVAGSNHKWSALINSKRVATFNGNNKRPEPNGELSKPLSEFATDGVVRINFKYNSAPT